MKDETVLLLALDTPSQVIRLFKNLIRSTVLSQDSNITDLSDLRYLISHLEIELDKIMTLEFSQLILQVLRHKDPKTIYNLQLVKDQNYIQIMKEILNKINDPLNTSVIVESYVQLTYVLHRAELS